jgi:hypothetical protein
VLRPRLHQLDPEGSRVQLKRILTPIGVEYLQAKVTEIDTGGHRITADGHTIGYDRLVLAAGSRLIRPELPGAEHLYDVDTVEGTARIAADVVVWTVGMQASPLTSQKPGNRDRLGRLEVDRRLRVSGDVFAAGAVTTTGWDRKVRLTGAEAKDRKRSILKLIHPPVDDAEQILQRPVNGARESAADPGRELRVPPDHPRGTPSQRPSHLPAKTRQVAAGGARSPRLHDLSRVGVRLAKHAGLEDATTAHIGRHTFVTRLIRGGEDLVTVAELTGHVRLETLKVYSHPTDDKRGALRHLTVDRWPRQKGALAMLRRTEPAVVSVGTAEPVRPNGIRR